MAGIHAGAFVDAWTIIPDRELDVRLCHVIVVTRVFRCRARL